MISLQDEIAACRAMAKHHRESARLLRMRKAIERNPVERMKTGWAVTERVRAAQACDARAKELKKEMGK